MFVFTCKLAHLFILNHLHPNISMHILYTILHTFPKGADKENLFINQELL